MTPQPDETRVAAREYELPENARGHEWRRDDDGEVDIFGVEYGHHNGPICVKCGYGFCHHCADGPGEDCNV